MLMSCCDEPVAPCESGECSGFDEVVALLPKGQIWDVNRPSIYSQYVQALGHIKTKLNKIICQEYNELNPCKSKRLFSYWADFYKLPPCVEQSQENLCQWIELIYNQNCPIGSKGFLQKAVEFVLPNVDIKIEFNPIHARRWRADSLCANNNAIVITTPVKHFNYYQYDGDFPHDRPDGENCRKYFIAKIECLRKCVFPMGASVGYKTSEKGRHDINNWQNVTPAKPPQIYYQCKNQTNQCNY